jgi:hypothetical protein
VPAKRAEHEYPGSGAGACRRPLRPLQRQIT